MAETGPWTQHPWTRRRRSHSPPASLRGAVRMARQASPSLSGRCRCHTCLRAGYGRVRAAGADLAALCLCYCVSRETIATWVVCGNMSTGGTKRRVKPPATSRRRSRARSRPTSSVPCPELYAHRAAVQPNQPPVPFSPVGGSWAVWLARRHVGNPLLPLWGHCSTKDRSRKTTKVTTCHIAVVSANVG